MFALIVWLPWQALAQPTYIAPESVGATLDLEAMAALIGDNELALVASHPDGTFKQATVMAVVNAPRDIVWGVITDYDNFAEFLPGIDRANITYAQGDETVIAYRLNVPGPNISYTVRYTHNYPDSIDMRLEDDKGAIKTGGWRFELYPFDDGKKTFIVYYLITDVKEASWIIRYILKNHPVLEHGINVATGLVTVRPMKMRAEALAK
jgi:ribosome-associated toxin RatA of RatAB toxin-antitoxin module